MPIRPHRLEAEALVLLRRRIGLGHQASQNRTHPLLDRGIADRLHLLRVRLKIVKPVPLMHHARPALTAGEHLISAQPRVNEKPGG